MYVYLQQSEIEGERVNWLELFLIHGSMGSYLSCLRGGWSVLESERKSRMK